MICWGRGTGLVAGRRILDLTSNPAGHGILARVHSSEGLGPALSRDLA